MPNSARSILIVGMLVFSIWEYICNENNQDAEHMIGK